MILSFFSSLFAGLGWTILGIAVAAAVALWVFGRLVPAWLPPLIIVLLGAAFIGNNVLKNDQLQAEKLAHATTKQQHADVLKSLAEQVAAAHTLALEQANALRGRERSLQTAFDERDLEAKNAEAKLRTQLDIARSTSERLSDQLTKIRGAYASDCAAANSAARAAGVRTPAACAVGVLADLYRDEQRRSRIFAAEADAARHRGLTCERLYDAARKALTHQ